MDHFTLEHYREIIEEAQKAYRFIPFRGLDDIPESDCRIILRHDLDSSLRHAATMAKLERDLGVSATYFVQLHSDYYSATSDSGTSDLLALRDFGHEIGLHYDPNYYGRLGIPFEDGILGDIEILERILGQRVISVSRHMPLVSKEKGKLPDRLVYDAYNPRFINGEFKYLSDSNGVFREGCFCEHLAEKRNYCFLVHPIWWVVPGEDWEKKLLHQKQFYINNMDNLINNKIREYNRIMANRAEYDEKFRERN